ncbi:MAG: hypothetical protein IJM46_10710 [Oscillospiraceae bacterium]|nr:hypothetical protein [Oscillospiraceae bacterium]
MTFSEFAQALHPCVGGSIVEFTRNLLSGGLRTNKATIEDLHPSTLRNYYHGSRQLTLLWADLYDAWDKQEFMRYVESTYKAEAFEIISERFSELGFEIKPDCVPERLAEILEGILDEVLKGTVPKQSKSFPKNKQTASRMLDFDRKSLAKIIEELDESLQYLQDPLHEYMIGWEYLRAHQRAEYEVNIASHIGKITECCRKIERCAKRYPDFSELMKLCKIGLVIFDKYYSVHDREDFSDYESYLTEFREVIDLVSGKLVAF